VRLGTPDFDVVLSPKAKTLFDALPADIRQKARNAMAHFRKRPQGEHLGGRLQGLRSHHVLKNKCRILWRMQSGTKHTVEIVWTGKRDDNPYALSVEELLGKLA
jgi:hypothetical protein